MTNEKCGDKYVFIFNVHGTKYNRPSIMSGHSDVIKYWIYKALYNIRVGHSTANASKQK